MIDMQLTFTINTQWEKLTRESIERGMTAGIMIVRTRAVEGAPFDTGRLRSSLTPDVKDVHGRIVGRVWTNVDYAIYQEFGTRFMEGQPYMRPAIYNNESEIINAVAYEIKQTL